LYIHRFSSAQQIIFLTFYTKNLKKYFPKLAIPSVGLCHSFQVSCKCIATLQALDPKQNKNNQKAKIAYKSDISYGFFPGCLAMEM